MDESDCPVQLAAEEETTYFSTGKDIYSKVLHQQGMPKLVHSDCFEPKFRECQPAVPTTSSSSP